MNGRSLLSVNDALTSDLMAEAGSYSDYPGVLDRLIAELRKCDGISVRKVDRRPTSTVEAASASSVWRSSYLFEVQYSAASASVAEAKIRQLVTELSVGSSALRTVGAPAPVSYLGSWFVDGDTLRGHTTSVGNSSYVPAATPVRSQPGMVASSSSASGFSDLATPGHNAAFQLPASSSSASNLSQNTINPPSPLSARERKELEADKKLMRCRGMRLKHDSADSSSRLTCMVCKRSLPLRELPLVERSRWQVCRRMKPKHDWTRKKDCQPIRPKTRQLKAKPKTITKVPSIHGIYFTLV